MLLQALPSTECQRTSERGPPQCDVSTSNRGIMAPKSTERKVLVELGAQSNQSDQPDQSDQPEQLQVNSNSF